MADPLKDLSEIPERLGDLLSDVLRMVRVAESLQYCFMPTGDWMVDATPAPHRPKGAISFHIVAEGRCTLDLDGQKFDLAAGDVAVLPFGTSHTLWSRKGAPEIDPGGDLPPKPWREIPMMRYGQGPPDVRILCGYLVCDPMRFQPFRDVLPPFIRVETKAVKDDWLPGMLAQIVAEVDRPQQGGSSVLERLTEVMFIEILRREIAHATPGAKGWLAALNDVALGAVCRNCIVIRPVCGHWPRWL